MKSCRKRMFLGSKDLLKDQVDPKSKSFLREDFLNICTRRSETYATITTKCLVWFAGERFGAQNKPPHCVRLCLGGSDPIVMAAFNLGWW